AVSSSAVALTRGSRWCDLTDRDGNPVLLVGRGQAVRHETLDLASGGSNPPAPAISGAEAPDPAGSRSPRPVRRPAVDVISDEPTLPSGIEDGRGHGRKPSQSP